MRRELLVGSLVCLFGCGSERAPSLERGSLSSTELPSEPLGVSIDIRPVTDEGWSGRMVVVSVPRADREVDIVTARRPTALQHIVQPVEPSPPYAAVNGGFYHPNGRPTGLVRAEAETLFPLTEDGGSGVLVVSGDGLSIVHRDQYVEGPEIVAALQSIDRLVAGGRSLVSSSASNRRAARTVLALDARGTLHLVALFDERAVGRESDEEIQLDPDSTRTGPTLAQIAEILRAPPARGGVGAISALGLDGGYSTSMEVALETRRLRIQAYQRTINAVLVRFP